LLSKGEKARERDGEKVWYCYEASRHTHISVYFFRYTESVREYIANLLSYIFMLNIIFYK